MLSPEFLQAMIGTQFLKYLLRKEKIQQNVHVKKCPRCFSNFMHVQLQFRQVGKGPFYSCLIQSGFQQYNFSKTADYNCPQHHNVRGMLHTIQYSLITVSSIPNLDQLRLFWRTKLHQPHDLLINFSLFTPIQTTGTHFRYNKGSL